MLNRIVTKYRLTWAGIAVLVAVLAWAYIKTLFGGV